MYSKVIKYEPKEASARVVWKNNYKEMPFEEFLAMSQVDCFYCGKPPSNCQNPAAGKNSSSRMREEGYFTYNGLDRKNSSLPHSVENCVPCCWPCNKAKGTASSEEFIERCTRIAQHQQTKKDTQ
jgi:hypothetical protein